MAMRHWGWTGTLEELSMAADEILGELVDHHYQLFGFANSQSQRRAWVDQLQILSGLGSSPALETLGAANWPLVLEFELPLEGGRRPDVVLFCGMTLVVLEFKMKSSSSLADIDQVAAYARDLAEYHEASHSLEIQPVLVLTKGASHLDKVDAVVEVSPDRLAEHLEKLYTPGAVELGPWLDASYRPLPQLIEAARRIFQNEPLPHVRRAESAGVPEAVDALARAANDAKENGQRTLALVAGVPGAGKTLVGLRLVYESYSDEAEAVFLSGNGPLVEVLRDALRSSVFVKDLHKVVLDYGQRDRLPRQHVYVFDEAQRAWDRQHMRHKRRLDCSEPDLMVQIGEQVEDWCLVVALIGEGQEIYVGEEGGLQQWADALDPSNTSADWDVICPPRLANLFSDHPTEVVPELDLSVSLRSRRAEILHLWVADILDENIEEASRKADEIHEGGFPLRICRNIETARQHARDRFAEEPDRRYGLIASSQARNLKSHGVDNEFMATKNVKKGRWFNAPPEDPLSCCALEAVVTEFGCQGLELDLPIVCWGSDHRWDSGHWQLSPTRRRDPVDDPVTLLRNAYRVLLTRGRDGLVIFVPPDRELDETFDVLQDAGLRPL